MTDLTSQRFQGRDGAELAWREIGRRAARVLLHGLIGSGRSCPAAAWPSDRRARGYRVILPDLRGHGDSARPHDPARYPPDILADDGLALIDQLGLDDYRLAGYSAGGKVVLRLLARGARPARAVVGGQGIDALDAESDRTGGYRSMLAAAANGDTSRPGSPEEASAHRVLRSCTSEVRPRLRFKLAQEFG